MCKQLTNNNNMEMKHQLNKLESECTQNVHNIYCKENMIYAIN